MRLSSEVMTCGFDRWEETMQHMMLVTNNGREKSLKWEVSLKVACMVDYIMRSRVSLVSNLQNPSHTLGVRLGVWRFETRVSHP